MVESLCCVYNGVRFVVYWYSWFIRFSLVITYYTPSIIICYNLQMYTMPHYIVGIYTENGEQSRVLTAAYTGIWLICNTIILHLSGPFFKIKCLDYSIS